MNETYSAYSAWLMINFDRRDELVKVKANSLAGIMDLVHATIEAKPDATSFTITLVRN